jgi:hypothetical protein
MERHFLSEDYKVASAVAGSHGRWHPVCCATRLLHTAARITRGTRRILAPPSQRLTPALALARAYPRLRQILPPA